MFLAADKLVWQMGPVTGLEALTLVSRFGSMAVLSQLTQMALFLGNLSVVKIAWPEGEIACGRNSKTVKHFSNIFGLMKMLMGQILGGCRRMQSTF